MSVWPGSPISLLTLPPRMGIVIQKKVCPVYISTFVSINCRQYTQRYCEPKSDDGGLLILENSKINYCA